MIVKADSGRQMRLVRKRENSLGVTTTADKRCELQKLALQYQEQEFSYPLRTMREYTASYSWHVRFAENSCAFL